MKAYQTPESQADAIEEQQRKWMQSGAAAEADTIWEQKLKQAKLLVVIKCKVCCSTKIGGQ